MPICNKKSTRNVLSFKDKGIYIKYLKLGYMQVCNKKSTRHALYFKNTANVLWMGLKYHHNFSLVISELGRVKKSYLANVWYNPPTIIYYIFGNICDFEGNISFFEDFFKTKNEKCESLTWIWEDKCK